MSGKLQKRDDTMPVYRVETKGKQCTLVERRTKGTHHLQLGLEAQGFTAEGDFRGIGS